MIIMPSLLKNLDAILRKIQLSHLCRYDYLQRTLAHTDVTVDPNFQRTFNGYYKMGQKRPDWYKYFYGMLEARKRDAGIQFQDVLRTIYDDKERVEPSFSSKFVATIRADSPVYDKYVRENLGLQIPPQGAPVQVRLEGYIQAFAQLSKRVTGLVSTNDFAAIRNCFNHAFPAYAHFTDVKKLDLVLWQHRVG